MKIKEIDSLIYMLQVEENRKIKDNKMIKYLQAKIKERIFENNIKLYKI